MLGKGMGFHRSPLTTLEAKWMQTLKVVRSTMVVILKVETVEWDIKVDTSAHDFVHLDKSQ